MPFALHEMVLGFWGAGMHPKCGKRAVVYLANKVPRPSSIEEVCNDEHEVLRYNERRNCYTISPPIELQITLRFERSCLIRPPQKKPITLSNRQIDQVFNTVKNDLYQVIIQEKWPTVGVYQFLNRLALALQHPAKLVVLKEHIDRNKKASYEKVFDTYPDPDRNEKYDQLIDEDHISSLVNEFGVKIYDTNYYLLIIRVKRTANEAKTSKDISFDFFHIRKMVYIK